MRGILLDRDGVINRERADYVKHWDEFVFLPGVLTALQRLATLPMPILVITNQSAIGRGIVSRQAVDEIHAQAQAAIHSAGGRIDGFFLCPHHPDAGCSCRKPQPGLLYQAAAQFALTIEQSVFVGDAITDYQAARAAGCQSILVKSGRQGTQLQQYLAEELAGEETVVRSESQQPRCTTQAPAVAPSQRPPLVADLSAAVELIMTQFTAT
ncbi:MAG: HAD family hydrolase [Caldilineaceae bacterium]|nr:HAD family hydrolase [Caldilineaceae bacterium]